jgi:hypothetical protein
LGVLCDLAVIALLRDSVRNIALTHAYYPARITGVPNDIYSFGINVAQINVIEIAPVSRLAFDPTDLKHDNLHPRNGALLKKVECRASKPALVT